MNVVKFEVARVRFIIRSTGPQIDILLPEIYRKFLPTTVGKQTLPTVSDSSIDNVLIELKSGIAHRHITETTALSSEPSWQVSLDQRDRFVFKIDRPSRILVMENDFSSGFMYMEEVISEKSSYPFFTLDIVTFSNWLANRGDLLLHAGGVSIDGQGYAFIGRSGAGKSTLVANLAEDSRVIVLGEDQVALRFLDNRYWIFGTPWHLNPERCSPIGVPLKKVFFLDRNAVDKLSPLSPSDGFKRLMQTAFIPYYRPVQVDLIMENLERLGTKIPYELLSYHLGDDILKSILEP